MAQKRDRERNVIETSFALANKPLEAGGKSPDRGGLAAGLRRAWHVAATSIGNARDISPESWMS